MQERVSCAVLDVPLDYAAPEGVTIPVHVAVLAARSTQPAADPFVLFAGGPGQAAGEFGALRAHVNSGQLSEETLHAELGQIVAGVKPGRESAEETNLFWHRGLSLSDIALGHALLQKAQQLGVGQRLRFY